MSLFDWNLLCKSNMLVIVCAILFAGIFIGISVLLSLKMRTQKKLMRELRLEEERYRIALELADDILFEYDVQKDIMNYSEKFREEFGRTPIIYSYTEQYLDMVNIHKEDEVIYKEFCNALHIGRSLIEYEFRMRNRFGQYEWFQIRCKTIVNNLNAPARVIGKIVNIDEQKRKVEDLQFKAQRDPLTSIYNKGATRDKISKIFRHSKPYENHALFVIDVDNFKQVNDSYGHMFGDYVLTSIVSHVTSIFRDADVVGRIGGDEFVVLMRSVTSKSQVEKKATHLCQAFHKRYSQNGETITISGSIGIAVFPMDGDTYETLVEHADSALYEVKGNGKNNYCFYEKNAGEESSQM